MENERRHSQECLLSFLVLDTSKVEDLCSLAMTDAWTPPKDDGLVAPVTQGLAEATKGIERIEEVSEGLRRIRREADAEVWAFIRWWESTHRPAVRVVATFGPPLPIPKKEGTE